MKSWTFHIMTFGCKVNQYESQSIREAWQALGGTEVTDPARADVALVNSCAITAQGERDARHALYRLRRAAPHARCILTGCSARLAAADLAGSDLPDALVPQEAKSALLQGPWTLSENITTAVPRPYPPLRISRFRRARPVLKVQDGCSHRCTYCIVPLTRGPAVSRAPQAVLEEARRLLDAGHREIMLSGINLRQYGRDLDAGITFWTLLELLDRELAPQWTGRARLRISSLEPSQLDSRGLDSLLASRMVCPHVHLSLQSGSSAVLRRMGRGHYRPDILKKQLETLHQAWPVMGLGADILMGFPGENAAHVQETLALVESLPLTYAHVFPYSRRPGTPAAAFPEQVPHQEKLRRAAAVRTAVARKRRHFLQELLQQPDMLVAPDGADSGKGVNEWYVTCRFRSLPARKGHDLLSARAVGVEGNALVVIPTSDGET